MNLLPALAFALLSLLTASISSSSPISTAFLSPQSADQEFQLYRRKAETVMQQIEIHIRKISRINKQINLAENAKPLEGLEELWEDSSGRVIFQRDNLIRRFKEQRQEHMISINNLKNNFEESTVSELRKMIDEYETGMKELLEEIEKRKKQIEFWKCMMEGKLRGGTAWEDCKGEIHMSPSAQSTKETAKNNIKMAKNSITTYQKRYNILKQKRDKLISLLQRFSGGGGFNMEEINAAGEEFYQLYPIIRNCPGPGDELTVAQMRKKGFIWLDHACKWVSLVEMSEEQTQKQMDGLQEQVMKFADLMDEDNRDMITYMLHLIKENGISADTIGRLQRLRNSTFLMWSAQMDLAHKDLADMEQITVGVDTLTLIIPIVNDWRDLQEAIEGKDSWTGRELKWWERALSGLGLIAGSGTYFRSVMNNSPELAERLTQLVSKQARLSAEEAAAFKRISAILESTEEGQSLRRSLLDSPEAVSRHSAFKRLRQEAEDKVARFRSATDVEERMRAALEIKSDWQAIAMLNKQDENLVLSFNAHMQGIYDEVDDMVMRKLVDRINQSGGWGTRTFGRGDDVRFIVSPDDVTVFSATNTASRPKAGADRDFTLRVFGEDVDSRVSQKLYNEAMHEVLSEHKLLPPGVTKENIGKHFDQVSVDYMHAEAYADLEKILNPTTLHLADPHQVAKVIAYKGIEPINEALKIIEKGGDLVEAEQHMRYGYYQLLKQYNNQAMKFTELARRKQLVKIPQKLEASMRIFERVVNTGDISTVEAQKMLRELGMTPKDVANLLGDYVAGLMILVSK